MEEPTFSICSMSFKSSSFRQYLRITAPRGIHPVASSTESGSHIGPSSTLGVNLRHDPVDVRRSGPDGVSLHAVHGDHNADADIRRARVGVAFIDANMARRGKQRATRTMLNRGRASIIATDAVVLRRLRLAAAPNSEMVLTDLIRSRRPAP